MTVSSLLRSIRGPGQDPSELPSVCSHSMNTLRFTMMSEQSSKPSQKRESCKTAHCSALSSPRTITSQKSLFLPLLLVFSLTTHRKGHTISTLPTHVYTADLERMYSKFPGTSYICREGQQAPVATFIAVLSLQQFRVILDRKT